MGRAVYLDDKENGIKVSVRAEPGAKVQIILFSDDTSHEKPGTLPSMLCEWYPHEALRAAALFVEAEEALHRRPRISWNKDESALGLSLVIESQKEDAMVQVRLNSTESKDFASRDLPCDGVTELISALQQAAQASRSQCDSFNDEDDWWDDD
jgi:hypothetical protein